jgi:hypothetical protein
MGRAQPIFFNLENSMIALQAYIDQKNKWQKLFKGPQYEIQTAKGRQVVAACLDSDLSPENLTCDGELSRAEINRRHKVLTAAATELARMDPAAAKAIYELYTGE